MKIILEEYISEWKNKFQEEKQRIEKSFFDIAIQVEHIGSTSIEGLGAKPIIDVLIGLTDFSKANTLIERVTGIGYQYIQQYDEDMPYSRFFIKETEGIRTHHIHMVEINTQFWIRHLAFRDYLRNKSEAKLEYDALKRELSTKEWKDVNEYAHAKSEFIQAIERKALSTHLP